MRHYCIPPAFDPTVMVDIDALRKELLVDQDETMVDTSMMLEEDGDDAGMKIE